MYCLLTAKTVDITCFLLESYKNTRTIDSHFRVAVFFYQAGNRLQWVRS